jgi:hypothetical protein
MIVKDKLIITFVGSQRRALPWHRGVLPDWLFFCAADFRP